MQHTKKTSAARCVGMLNRHFKQYCDGRLEPYGLTNGLYLYLFYIWHYPGCSLADIRERMQVDKALVTRSVARLCELGYVSKDRRSGDGRSYCLNLTEAGKEVVSYAGTLPHDWERRVFEMLSGAEQETLTLLLEKVCGGMTSGE